MSDGQCGGEPATLAVWMGGRVLPCISLGHADHVVWTCVLFLFLHLA